jgi:hypothetical protein
MNHKGIPAGVLLEPKTMHKERRIWHSESELPDIIVAISWEPDIYRAAGRS